jgi:diadenosine tetraphosphatase ApaH/serine/threonine PP2A family protein phosphatase
MTLLPPDEFEEMIVKVARIIREEREQGRLDDEPIADNRLIRLPPHGRSIFVGDIHGELDSIQEILRRTNFVDANLGSCDRGYIVFLGDLVDRGPNSVEALTTLFALKIRFKGNVILLKGNHELPDVNFRYGFKDEVRRKYQPHGNEVYELCNRLFEKLPHAVVTANGIFAAHGGIPENVSTIAQVADLDGDELEQLLWNDPRPEIEGFEQNHGRDPMGLTSIKYFGDDVTTRFLNGIGAKILVRGHEYYGGSGYMAVSKRVLTIFSAKYGRPDWKRAYIDTDLSKDIEDVNSLIPDIRLF